MEILNKMTKACSESELSALSERLDQMAKEVHPIMLKYGGTPSTHCVTTCGWEWVPGKRLPDGKYLPPHQVWVCRLDCPGDR